MLLQGPIERISPAAVARGPRRTGRRLAAGFALVLAGLLFALPVRAIEVKKVVSPGGITAWLVEDHTNPIVTLNFAFRVGALLDPAGKEGTARMMAGLMDEGAGDLDSQAFQKRLDDLSISVSFNAGYDNFRGSVRTLTENRAEAFRLLSLALTKPRFDQDPLERLRAQTLVRLARAANSPRRVAVRRWWRTSFPKHPYGRPGLGTPDSVKAIGAADLRAFHGKYLGRDTLVVGVVGDITPAQLKPALDRIFGGLPRTSKRPTIPQAMAAAKGKITIVRRPVPQSFVVFGHNGIRRSHPDYYAAYVMNYILGGGSFSSRLYNEVREKRGLAYFVYSSLSPMTHGAVIIGAVGTRNARVKQSIDLIRGEWRRMAEKGVTREELEAAKTYLTGSYPLRFSSSKAIARMLVGVQMEKLGMDYFNKRNGYIRAVTRADIMRVAKRLLDANRLDFIVVGDPKGLKDG